MILQMLCNICQARLYYWNLKFVYDDNIGEYVWFCKNHVKCLRNRAEKREKLA